MFTKFARRSSAVVALAAALAAAPGAFAQTEEPESNVNQTGAVELTFDHAQEGLDVLAATIEYGLAVRFADGWTVQTDAVFEPVADPVEDAQFEDHDAYLETLSLQYAGETFTVYAGKIDPVFGSAADLSPGLYGVEVGEAYQLVEQLGLGGDVALTDLFGLEGEHTLSAAVFRADRSVLSSSLGGKRERVTLADGGLANTEDFKSVAVSLDGALANGLAYSLGYRHLATDTTGESDEDMAVFGLSYALPEEGGLDLSWMAEVGASRNADGIDDASRDFYTAGAMLGLDSFGLDGWFINAIVSGWNENAAAGDADLRKFEVSIGRQLTDELTFEFGAQDARLASDSDTVIGARLAWAFG